MREINGANMDIDLFPADVDWERMKRWAKVLLVVGIVWLVGVMFFSYFMCGRYSAAMECTSSEFYGLSVSCNFERCFIGGAIFSIPSWIIFLVVAIWGRSK